MDIHLRYWDGYEHIYTTRYYNSEFLGKHSSTIEVYELTEKAEKVNDLISVLTQKWKYQKYLMLPPPNSSLRRTNSIS